MKKDRTPLDTVKRVFKSGQLHEKALNEGIFVDNVCYRTQKFIQTGIQIICCFKCQKFGHFSMNCKSDIACGHCTGIHKYKDCTMKHETPKCVNCSKAHTSDSTSCTASIRQLITVYNARGVEIPISVKKRVASLLYRRNIKLSQINICGMSNHSQIALNKFINFTNRHALCINETKKDMTCDEFDNYTVVSAINGNNSRGVAMLIHSSLPYLRIYDLEIIHFDSLWIVTVLNGKKVVIGTAYINLLRLYM